MPRPKLSRTVGLLFFCPVFEILQILGFGLYISACVIQRQFSARSIRTLLSLCLLLPGVTLFSLIVMRSCVQARFLPSSTMEPNLKINDRVLFENVSNMKGTPIERGQIVIFHAPAIAGEEPKRGLAALLGELTGIPVFPNQTTFVKRVIGVANDRIQLRPGDGTYINGKKIDETSYVLEPAAYRLERLSDIKGPSTNGSPIQPYTSNAPIVVPPNMVFVLGDNRNNSIDSHVFGFIDKHLVIGRGWEIFYPTQYYIHPPFWHRPHN
ncbi:MAG: signal peptidase I [Candidatus Obscuribacterales bacterium]